MERDLRKDSEQVVRKAISACLPDEAVRRALEGKEFPGRVVLVSVGKAAWRMADAVWKALNGKISKGVVLTKYGHLSGPIGNLELYEAGHPVVDEASVAGTERILELVKGLAPSDTVLFLVSGGGSALFEKPLIPLSELAEVNRQLLACGASIGEMNGIRKRLSAVKGGRFAELCRPAKVFAVVLSDVIGDRLDVIASGPAAPDRSTCKEAAETVKRYGLQLSEKAMELLQKETPKALENVETCITGSVSELCRAAAEEAGRLGYRPVILTDSLGCQAKEAGAFLGACARYQRLHAVEPLALIAGGETVVELTGHGKGGRNQELALAAAAEIAGMDGVCVVSAGSDGTDGPTDAAGGIVDGKTAGTLKICGISIPEVLRQNDAYPALERCGGLLMTGPTGTNVNDVAAALIYPEKS